MEYFVLALGMFIAGFFSLVIFLPLSHVIKQLSEICTFGLMENLKERMESYEEGGLGGRSGLVILGGSLGLAGIMTVILLLMGKTGEDLLDIFLDNTVIGSVTSLLGGDLNLAAASIVVSVGISVYIGDLLSLQFQGTKWYVKLLITPIRVVGTVALAIILQVPFGWLATLGELLIAPLFQGWEGQTFLNILRMIPAIIVGYIALVLILTTVSEYLATFASIMMGFILLVLILLIPLLFGFGLPNTISDGAFVVIILGIEALKEYRVDIYAFLSERITFLPDLDELDLT